MSGTATDFTAASIVSAALGVALYGAPFKSFYSKVLKDHSGKFTGFGIGSFFSSDGPPVGKTGDKKDDKTIGGQRINVVSKMAALAAALTALGVSFLTGGASLIIQLAFGPPIRQLWQTIGWISVGIECLALTFLILQVCQGKVEENPPPAYYGQPKFGIMRKLLRPWTPRPYSFFAFLGSAVAILLAFPNLAGVPSPGPPSASTPSTTVFRFPPPTGVKITAVGSNTVGLQWQTVPSGSIYPTSYTVAVYNSKGQVASESTVSTPDAARRQGVTTIAGLTSKTSYHANVWPNGGKLAPSNTSVSFTTK